MKKLIYTSTALLLTFSLIFVSCEDDRPEPPGGISGTIVDQATGNPLNAANIRLFNATASMVASEVSGNDGFFQFSQLEPGEYTLTVTRTGFTELRGHPVTVRSGQTTPTSVPLAVLPPALRIMSTTNPPISIDSLAFGSEGVTTRTFSIFNDGPEPLTWLIINNSSWISNLSAESGTLQPGVSQPISITIDRTQLDGGRNVYLLNITSNSGSGELRITAVGPTPPTLNTLPVTNITTTTAMLHGEILTVGSPAYTERGFVFSLSPMPTLETSIARVTASLTGSRTYSATVTGLTLGQTYFVRAFAISGGRVGYSTNEVSFTAQQALPTVTTQEATHRNIGAGTITLNGTIVNAGDPIYTERGFVVGTTRNPTVQDATIVPASGMGTGSFSVNLTGRTIGSVYYVRTFATNVVGTAYGEEIAIDFTAIAPVVSTQATSQIGSTSAIFNGTIVVAGDPTFIERGFVYSTTPNPTFNDSRVIVSGSGAGTFNVNRAGLRLGTTYHVRAFALTDRDTVLGESVSFTTSVPSGTILIEGLLVDRTDRGAVAWHNSTGSQLLANDLCSSSTVGGMTGWRLPTRDELVMLHRNRASIGGFLNTGYWSDEYAGNQISGTWPNQMQTIFQWTVDFSTGNAVSVWVWRSWTGGAVETNPTTRRVRCVRTP